MVTLLNLHGNIGVSTTKKSTTTVYGGGDRT